MVYYNFNLYFLVKQEMYKMIFNNFQCILIEIHFNQKL